ncbi:MAG: hypothetical protein PVJ39_13985 [Gammaproteobacteria bacterium]|jgi:hypothetical protein
MLNLDSGIIELHPLATQFIVKSEILPGLWWPPNTKAKWFDPGFNGKLLWF